MDQRLSGQMGLCFDGVGGASPEVGMGMARSTHYQVECHDQFGNLKWVEEFDNLVVTAGLNDSLDKHLKGSGYTAAWYVGLTGGTPDFQPGDTMASHAGWTENTVYSDATRRTLTLGTVSGGSVDNSAAKAVFSMNGAYTVGGAFVTSVNTKGGTTGVLYGGGAFTADRTGTTPDTITVTITCTATAA
jgi:hypothetical protein